MVQSITPGEDTFIEVPTTPIVEESTTHAPSVITGSFIVEESGEPIKIDEEIIPVVIEEIITTPIMDAKPPIIEEIIKATTIVNESGSVSGSIEGE